MLPKVHSGVPEGRERCVKVTNMSAEIDALVVNPELLLLLLLFVIIQAFHLVVSALFRQFHEEMIDLLPLLIIQLTHPWLRLELQAPSPLFFLLNRADFSLNFLKVEYFDAAFESIIWHKLEIVLLPLSGSLKGANFCILAN